MAQIEVVMPQMGESITTGTITKWHKAVGDTIEIDEILLEISTDKVESEIPSPVKGRVDRLDYEEGETVDVGLCIAIIEDDLSKAPSSGGAPQKSAPKKEEAPKVQEETAQPTTQQVASSEEKSSKFFTPLVKAMAKKHGVSLNELESLPGSGAGGRFTKADFEAYLTSRQAPSQTASTAKASPPPAQVISSIVSSSTTSSGRVERIPMNNMRKAIAKNMVLSKQISPHVNSLSEVDMTHLVKFRESIKKDFEREEGFKITYTPFIIYAIIAALKEHPMVNASIENDEIVLKKDVNVGCAVAVPGNGLVVPVIKNADTLNMLGLCRAVNNLAHKARDGKLTMDELSGGTFTFTNVGTFGTLLATPIILQPQVGIYASGVIQKRPIVLDDAIAIRSMMYGTHTYDHRLVDGQLGGLFLESVHRNLAQMQPETLF